MLKAWPSYRTQKTPVAKQKQNSKQWREKYIATEARWVSGICHYDREFLNLTPIQISSSESRQQWQLRMGLASIPCVSRFQFSFNFSKFWQRSVIWSINDWRIIASHSEWTSILLLQHYFAFWKEPRYYARPNFLTFRFLYIHFSAPLSSKFDARPF